MMMASKSIPYTNESLKFICTMSIATDTISTMISCPSRASTSHTTRKKCAASSEYLSDIRSKMVSRIMHKKRAVMMIYTTRG